MTRSLELRGDRVRLRTTTADDRDALVAIRSTPDVRRRWRGDDLAAEFDRDLDVDEVVRLTITVGGVVVGLIQFEEETEPEYRHASIDVYVDPVHHRRGIASDAIATLVRHLFDDLGHHRITIDPAADNTAAIDCYAKIGFRRVGVMRSYERQSEGAWSDGLMMELLADDFDG